MSSPPDLRRVGEQLHAKLLDGASLTATSEVAEIFLPALLASLRKRFWNLEDPQLIDTAAEDALIEYFDNPSRFDAARAGLFTYLRTLAKSRLLDLLAGRKSRQSRERAVELGDAGSVYSDEAQEDSDPETSLARRAADERTLEHLREILPDPRDIEMIKLMMEGVRETSRYAELLGISDEAPEEQKDVVKRHKDRLKKTVQRKFRRQS